MFDEIRKLISVQRFDQALSRIEAELRKLKTPISEEAEIDYTELAGLRVSATTLKGEEDNIILDHVRRERFPEEVTYQIGDEHKVTLASKNLFLFPCDAMINAIHESRLLDVSERSASREILNRLEIGRAHV